jgi:CTP:molybdopterin cytidylyltransferase MocA
MGQPKLLLPWPPGTSATAGATLIEQMLTAWRASEVERIVVTVHPHDLRLHELARGPRTEVVVVDPPPADMRASVLAGLAHLRTTAAPTDRDAWLLAPADLPRLSPRAIGAVLAGWCRAPQALVVAAHEGRRGHPALFPWALADEVQRLAADGGIKQLFATHPVVEVEAGPEAVAPDIDTPADYS